MATKRITYLLIVYAAFMLHVFFSHYLSFFLLIFLLVLPFASLAIGLAQKNSLKVSMSRKTPITYKDKGVSIEIQASNRRAVIPSCVRVWLLIENTFNPETVEETVSLIVSKYPQTLSEEISSRHIGRIRISAQKVRTYDPLGLFSFKYKQEVPEVYTTVLPKITPTDSGFLNVSSEDIDSDEYSKHKPGWDVSEAFEIREYRSGDSSRKIHWKLSDKFDNLMVREGSMPISNLAVMIFDLNSGAETNGAKASGTEASGTGANGDSYDTLANEFFTYASSLVQEQISFRIMWHNNKVIESKTVSDEDSLEEIMYIILTMPHEGTVLQSFLREDFHIAPGTKILYFCSSFSDEDEKMLLDKFENCPIDVYSSNDGRKEDSLGLVGFHRSAGIEDDDENKETN